MKVIAYHTHYEIEDYELGACRKLEYLLSYRVNPNTYDPTRVEYYHYSDGILYIPRGVDPEDIKRTTGLPVYSYVKECNPYKKVSFSMNLLPRDEVQKEAIRFLLGKDEFKHTLKESQLVLSLEGGGGKTYCAIAALAMLETKMLVVCHTVDIRNQWVDRALKYTNLQPDAIKVITTGEQFIKYLKPDAKLQKTMNNEVIYLITHSLIHQCIKSLGFIAVNMVFCNLGIGLKVIDEFHKNIENTLMLDFATDVYKTFYLSATAGRTDDLDNQVFQTSFNRVFKLKRTTPKKISTYAIFNVFKSKLPQATIDGMFIRTRFSIHRYTEYELDEGTLLEKIKYWVYWLVNKDILTDDRMCIILASTIEACEFIAKQIKHEFPDKSVIAYHSKNKIDDNLENYNFICATLGMMGTGNDYNNLKAIINTQPYGSAVNADQLVHRLMRGNVDTLGSTYLIELIDGRVPNARRLFNKRYPIINQYVTESYVIDEYRRRKKDV